MITISRYFKLVYTWPMIQTRCALNICCLCHIQRRTFTTLFHRTNFTIAFTKINSTSVAKNLPLALTRQARRWARCWMQRVASLSTQRRQKMVPSLCQSRQSMPISSPLHGSENLIVVSLAGPSLSWWLAGWTVTKGVPIIVVHSN